jgi:hypothetical protein
MSTEDLSEEARRFIVEHIGSVAELELLLLVGQGASRDWSAQEVARELRIEPDWTAQRLEDLRARGFVAAIDGDEAAAGRYRYAPATTEHDVLVADLARGYATRRVSIITLIYSKPRDHIRSFANAFRLREKK